MRSVLVDRLRLPTLRDALALAALAALAPWAAWAAVRLPAGRALSVMTVNLRYGHGDPDTVMQLVRRHDVDVLSLQELTPTAARRLDQAGASARFPYRVLEPRSGAGGSGLLSRLPLREAARPSGTLHAMPQAQLAVPGVGSVLVKAVHTIPPLGGDVPAWREELGSLPRARPDGELRLLVGDFNATLDHHELRADRQRLPRRFRRRRHRPRRHLPRLATTADPDRDRPRARRPACACDGRRRGADSGQRPPRAARNAQPASVVIATRSNGGDERTAVASPGEPLAVGRRC